MLDWSRIKEPLSFPSVLAHRNLMTLLLLFFVFNLNAQVKTSIDTLLIRIGEEIEYTIEVEADTTALVLFPEGQSFQPLEVIDSYAVDTSYAEAKFRLIKKYGLTQFDSGRYKLPSQRVMIDDRPFLTDSALVEVRDVPVDTTKQKMFDIKPAIDVDRPPFDFKRLLYWLLPLLLLGGLVYFLFRRKKRREERERQLPPYEEALEALRKLDESELLTESKSKAYYTSLTEIVKRYIDREVDETALESTTDELIERLQLHKDAGHFDFDTETIKKLDVILKRADLVKFAKMQQEIGQARADRSSIEEIINATHEAIPEPTEEELLENEAYLEALAKKKKRKQWIQGIAAGVLILLLTAAVYGSITGFDNLRDKVLGNAMRELAEGQWYKSEYGNPAVIVETPEVLKRKDVKIPEESSGVILSSDHFEYGKFKEQFYISVSSSEYNPQVLEVQPIDLSMILEGVLKEIEDRGAINLVVKQETFSTEAGIEGIKAYGDFNLKLPNGKISKDPAAYEVLLFQQEQGTQLISIVYKKEDFYAVLVKDRVINSVELELQNSGQPKPKQE
ncbi:MAG: DUF4381 domain-containing protein [Flavobacteriaceae bacterium]|nr:DUF4381 domain-containing protein [Flavobacteriaceae bacterium]